MISASLLHPRMISNALLDCFCSQPGVMAVSLSLEEVEEIAEEAYICLYPVVANYKTMWKQLVVDHQSSSKEVSFNKFGHSRKLLDSRHKTVVTPNNDTLYSMAWLDLRTEPIILSLPEVPRNRYYSVQIIDGYTHNAAILGSRTTGNSSGNFLISGPMWQGKTPPTILKQVAVESDFAAVLVRIQIDCEEDLALVSSIQQGLLLTSLSRFTSQTKPTALPPPDLLPVDVKKLKTVEFFNYACFFMRFIDVHPSERNMFEKFAGICIVPGVYFPPHGMQTSVLAAIQRGMMNAIKKMRKTPNRSKEGSMSGCWHGFINPPNFGCRDVMQGRYLIRAMSAHVGLYGLDPTEAVYFRAVCDSSLAPLDGSKQCYIVRFPRDQIPRVQSFWSLSIYNKEKFFVANPINRYSIGDRTKGLVYDHDGSLTIWIQRSSPADPSNWLPAPDGLFSLVLRLYWPAEEILQKGYAPPNITAIRLA